jgi:hypothetical protein
MAERSCQWGTRRVANPGPGPAGHLPDHQGLEHLGGFPALCLGVGQHLGGDRADVRQPHPAQQPLQVRPQRRRRRGGWSRPLRIRGE